MSFIDLISKSFELRARGKLSDADLAFEHQRMARELFPQSRSLGEALQKFYDTPDGQRALKIATSTKFFEFQKDSSVGNGYEAVLKMNEDAELVKREQPKVRREQADTPNRDDDTDSEIEDADKVEEPFGAAVKRLMERGLNFDQAATVMVRKAARG
jgi:hypothetical protein